MLENHQSVGKAGWFVYILRCADHSFYTGVTTDLARRLRQHNAGLASRYTRSRLPVTLAYRERSLDRGAALRREAAIKRLTRRAKERLMGTRTCSASETGVSKYTS